MSDKLKDWFDPQAQGKNMFRPQSPEHILSKMALTMRAPYHKEAFVDVCHGFAARALAGKLASGEIPADAFDTVSIRLLGRRQFAGQTDFVMHTVIMSSDSGNTNDSVIIDDMLADPSFEGGYDPDGIYRSKLNSGSNQPREPLETVWEISLPDFMREY